jgi:putative redox protein
VKAELSQEVKRSPEGLKTNIKVAMQIEGDLLPEQREELFKQADACYIHRQIMAEWDIEHATDLDLVLV